MASTSASVYAAAALLALISAGSWYTLHTFPGHNGMWDHLEKYSQQAYMPHLKAHYRASLTGFKGVDDVLNVLNTFFFPVVDGSVPKAALFNVWFGGQALAICVVGFLDSLRAGNKWRVSSLFTLTFIIAQLVGGGVAMPFFLAIYLLTSATVSGSGLEVDANDLRIVPVAVILGAVVPCVLLALPSPGILTFQQKSDVIRLWQMFPILMPSIRLLLKPIFNGFFPKKATKAEQESLFATNYALALTFSVVSNVYFWSVSLTALFIPALFNPKIVKQLQPAGIFDSPVPWRAPHVEPIDNSAHWFMLWDLASIGTSYVIWAVTVNLAARKPSAGISTTLTTLLKTIVWSAIAGPVGAVTILVWHRDHHVLSKGEQSTRKAIK